MHFSGVQRVLGLLLMVFSTAMLLPAGIALFYADGEFDTFLKSFLLLLALGAIAWIPVRRSRQDLRRRD
ncbi:MAG TPA: potassium transporter, partial [Gammaproteobacteria bacterium]